MSLLKEQLQQQLTAIELLIATIDPIDYSDAIPEMGFASIGQHVRHTYEIIRELVRNYHTGTINYSNRERDHRIENIPAYALEVSSELKTGIQLADRPLTLREEEADAFLPTTYFRELHFVLDHTIHHMALIKTALRIIGKDTTDDRFGMAYSTLKHNSTVCVR